MSEDKQQIDLTPNHHINRVTIETVTEELAVWRKNKKKQNERIPASIWDKIFVLLETYPQPKVCAECGVDGFQIHRASVRLSRPISVKQSPTMNSPSLSKNNELNPNPLLVEFHRKDGALMKVYTNMDLPELLNTFMSQ